MAITDGTKLEIYNEALRILGSRRLASLTEARESRRVLDDIWGTSDRVVRRALEKADWNFGTRSSLLVFSTSIQPDFGFRRAYEKPSDLARLTSLASDEYFNHVLTAREYSDEAGYWFADLDELYVKYVSDDDGYGLDGAKFSQAFIEYIAAYLAWEGCERITNSTAKQDRARVLMRDALGGAKSRDAMDEGVKSLPQGSWARSRHRGRRDDDRFGGGTL